VSLCVGDGALEPLDVELVRVDPEHVAVPTRNQDLAVGASRRRVERLAQL
jgi:hypothetical protein